MKAIVYTCKKQYRDIPFAHRQWQHEGHCADIHGHNWVFEFEFEAACLDECDFVVDFGKLRKLKEYIQQYDHALVLCSDDPMLADIEKLLCSRVIKLPSVSVEGLCLHTYNKANEIVKEITDGRAWVNRVTIYEDSKNSASYVKTD